MKLILSISFLFINLLSTAKQYFKTPLLKMEQQQVPPNQGRSQASRFLYEICTNEFTQ